MNSTFWVNVYNQLHNWISTVGLFILLELAQYALDNATWTWRGLVVSVAGAILKYFATRDDHIKTQQAVKKAVEQTVITTQEVIAKTEQGQGA